MALTDVAEGTIVRAITRLDETCREVRDAARVIGDAALMRKMEDAQGKIKRDSEYFSDEFRSRFCPVSRNMSISSSRGRVRKALLFMDVWYIVVWNWKGPICGEKPCFSRACRRSLDAHYAEVAISHPVIFSELSESVGVCLALGLGKKDSGWKAEETSRSSDLDCYQDEGSCAGFEACLGSSSS